MSIMVKFVPQGNYTSMHIRDRKWRISSVYIPTQAIIDFLCGERPMDYHDCNDHVTFYHYSDSIIHVKVTHVVPYSNGEIGGRQVHLFLDKAKLTELIDTEPFAMLSDEPNDIPKIRFTGLALSRVVADKLKRRALSKYLRDGFQWHGAKEIKLYDDGRYDFFFEEVMEDDSIGLVGGLILHEGMMQRGLYSYHREAYSLHT